MGALLEEIGDTPDDGRRIGVDLLRGAAVLHRVHDDELALGRGELRIELGVGEALDVVDVAGLRLKRPELRLGRKRIDGDGPALLLREGHDRLQAGDLDFGRDRFRARIAGGGADVERVRAVCDQRARVLARGLGIEKAPGVGKRIVGDVEDPEDEGVPHGRRTRKWLRRSRPRTQVGLRRLQCKLLLMLGVSRFQLLGCSIFEFSDCLRGRGRWAICKRLIARGFSRLQHSARRNFENFPAAAGGHNPGRGCGTARYWLCRVFCTFNGSFGGIFRCDADGKRCQARQLTETTAERGKKLRFGQAMANDVRHPFVAQEHRQQPIIVLFLCK